MISLHHYARFSQSEAEDLKQWPLSEVPQESDQCQSKQQLGDTLAWPTPPHQPRLSTLSLHVAAPGQGQAAGPPSGRLWL